MKNISLECKCGQVTEFVREDDGTLHYAARHGKEGEPAKLACFNCHAVLAEALPPREIQVISGTKVPEIPTVRDFRGEPPAPETTAETQPAETAPAERSPAKTETKKKK